MVEVFLSTPTPQLTCISLRWSIPFRPEPLHNWFYISELTFWTKFTFLGLGQVALNGSLLSVYPIHNWSWPPEPAALSSPPRPVGLGESSLYFPPRVQPWSSLHNWSSALHSLPIPYLYPTCPPRGTW